MEKTYRLGLVGLVLAGTAMFGGSPRETSAADAEINNAIDRIGGAAAEALSNIERSQGNSEKAAGYRALSNIFRDTARINYDSSQREKDRQALLGAARIRAGGGEQNAELQKQIQENNRLQRQLLEQKNSYAAPQRQAMLQQTSFDLSEEKTAIARERYGREVQNVLAQNMDIVFTCTSWTDKNKNDRVEDNEFGRFTRIVEEGRTINAAYRYINLGTAPIDVNYTLYSLEPSKDNEAPKRKFIENGNLVHLPAGMECVHFKIFNLQPGAYFFRTESSKGNLETLFFVTERENSQQAGRSEPRAVPAHIIDGIAIGDSYEDKDNSGRIDLEEFHPCDNFDLGKVVRIGFGAGNLNYNQTSTSEYQIYRRDKKTADGVMLERVGGKSLDNLDPRKTYVTLLNLTPKKSGIYTILLKKDNQIIAQKEFTVNDSENMQAAQPSASQR